MGLALVYVEKAKDTHLFLFLLTNLNMVKDLQGREIIQQRWIWLA